MSTVTDREIGKTSRETPIPPEHPLGLDLDRECSVLAQRSSVRKLSLGHNIIVPRVPLPCMVYTFSDDRPSGGIEATQSDEIILDGESILYV
jgi:hypothetical protein